MFGLVHCNASIIARQNTDPDLFFVRNLVKSWLWPIITFFGVTGNILAIIVLTKRRMIMSSTNNYLVALALVDIAYLILTLILNTLQNPCFKSTSISEIISIISRPLADFSSNTSVWLTVTFTVERWVAITYPLQSRTWCTVYRARKIILSVMCASFICTLPSAFEMKLIRTTEMKNSTKEIVYIRSIKATPTVLGNSLLYQKIYFNFVTFAIIWIPLLLLLIFNTILISYVRRSKKNHQQNNDGFELRRHNRVNQYEQRKTTIMLIAVVIVFTVCQIPQAISLTLVSYFPKLSQSTRVLIYNNFANCLVAVNASINFVLYCCFSERFRSTFRSNLTVLSKYCVQFMQPKWKIQTNQYQYQSKYSLSVDNMSCLDQSVHSLPTNHYHTRLSNVSIDLNPKYLQHLNQKFQDNRVLVSTSAKSKPTSQTKVTTSVIRVRDIPTDADQMLKLDNNQATLKNLPTTEILSSFPSRQKSMSLNRLNHPIKKFQYHSKSHTLLDHKAPIWSKRYQSHSAIEHLLNRPNSMS